MNLKMENYFRNSAIVPSTWYFVRFCLVALFVLGAPSLARAEGNFVQEVRIAGVQRVPEATIRAQLKTVPGKIVDRTEINADIHELFKLGFFKEIAVEEVRGTHGWIYTFTFLEKPIISKIAIEGNKKIKDAALREVITIPLYQPLNEKKVAESMEAMRQLYAKKKYYLVDIDYHLRVAPASGDHEFVFAIKEHEPALVRQVGFLGNTVFTDDELRKIVRTRKKGPFAFLTSSGKYDEELLKQDVMRLTFHYLKNGYLKVKVENPEVTITKDKRYFFVLFPVHEGDLYHIGKVDLDGDILTTKEELLSRLLTKPGQIYNREHIERDLQSLTKAYADLGYAFVLTRPLTNTHEAEKTADIIFHVSRGSRILVEKIEIHGNTTTRDKIIRRELRIKEGDIYNESKIEESKQRVMALGFFKDVNFATPRGSRDDTIQLDVTVEERSTGSFSLGAGFSTAENFVLTGSLSKQNLFGRGYNSEFSAEISSKRQQFLFSVLDPYFLDTEWIVGTNGFRTIYHFDNFSRESYGGSFSVGHRIFEHSSVSIAYEAEQVSAVAFAEEVPQRFRDNASGLTSMISFTASRDTRDNRIYPTKGLFNTFQFEISGAKLGADNSFYRVTGKTQFYQPVYKSLIFKTFGRVGYMGNLNDRLVPLFERYFLGGVNSLRGFRPQSVGPKEQVTRGDGSLVDFVSGGDKLVVMNTELEYPIYEPAGLKAVVFFSTPGIPMRKGAVWRI